jgi:hypothetical protein
MTPGPVRWPRIASSVPSETFLAGVRFRGRMSEAEGFLCSTLPASPWWPARPRSIPPTQPQPSRPLPRSRPRCRPARDPRPVLLSPLVSGSLAPANKPFTRAEGDATRATQQGRRDKGDATRATQQGEPRGSPRSCEVKPGVHSLRVAGPESPVHHELPSATLAPRLRTPRQAGLARARRDWPGRAARSRPPRSGRYPDPGGGLIRAPPRSRQHPDPGSTPIRAAC